MDHEHDHESPTARHQDAAPREFPDSGIVEQNGNPTCYHQACPVCGRNLRIRVTLLGQRVYCQHCGGGFIATDGCVDTAVPYAAEVRPQAEIVDELIERAAVLLGLTTVQDALE